MADGHNDELMTEEPLAESRRMTEPHTTVLGQQIATNELRDIQLSMIDDR